VFHLWDCFKLIFRRRFQKSAKFYRVIRVALFIT
jgi:hypothetical protein